jgi:hypothetical protein
MSTKDETDRIASLPRPNAAHSDSVERAILHTLAYADVFDFPLTAQEIHHYLIGVAASLETVQRALDNGRLAPQRLTRRQGCYTLMGREHLVKVRQRRVHSAAHLWPQAERYGRVVADLPFVRMVALTGALAVHNVEADADIDYLIVTAPDRLWLCRGLIILLVRWSARRGVTLCPNYLLSERAMLLPEHNLYTAHELVQMVPLAGLSTYWQMRQLNSWANSFLPNARKPLQQVDGHSGGDGLGCALAEPILRTPIGDWLERWEMDRKVAKFNRQGDGDAEVAFSRDWCKGHFDAHCRRTLKEYAERLARLEL